jgi:hypothetical protein
MNDIRGWSRGNHWYLWQWGRCRILNKGHLAMPIFNDHRTLVCEMVK